VIKFLIIRFSSIGDIVLTTPLVRCLKQQVEGAEVHYVTKKQFVSVLYGNPHIDKIHVFEDNLKDLISQLKKEEFDYIIDLHNNIRSNLVTRKLKLISFAFDKINFHKALITSPLKLNILPHIHIVDRYFATVKVFDVKNDEKGLDFFILPENEIKINQFPLEYRNGYIAFVIGAKHNTKQLPVEKIIGLCELVNFPVILLGGKDDFKTGELIVNSKKFKAVLNACGKYNLQESASLIDMSSLVITHDTGLMHIAAAFNKTIFSIWGNTIPEFGMYPYNPRKDNQLFEIANLKCRPCSKIGFKKCPRNHFKCMNLLDINNFSKEINSYLSK
jgi:ADP-heptose:LPS heptosyltransferase